MDKVCRRWPRDPDFLHLRAIVRHQKGDNAQALKLVRQALKLAPDDPGAHNTHGNALSELGRHAEARKAYGEAIALDPKVAPAHVGMAQALNALERFDEAASHAREAIALSPSSAAAHCNLGVALAGLGAFEGAVDAHGEAIAIDPDHLLANSNVVLPLVRLGRLGRAERHARAAMELDPRFASAHGSLGVVLKMRGQLDEAIEAFRVALDLDSGNDSAFCNMLSCLFGSCLWDEGQAMLGQIQRRLDKAGEGTLAFQPLAFLLHYVAQNHPAHDRVLESLGRVYAARAKALPALPRVADNPEVFNLGYVSPHFGDHPISHVTRSVYALHDRSRFRVHCFSLADRSMDPGPYLEDIREGADRFHDLSAMSDHEAAAYIREQGVHVLIDLTGHLEGARPAVLAARPAPVQAHWLGHGGGLQSPFIDFLIGDAVVTPPEDDDKYRETVIRLDTAYTFFDLSPIDDGPLKRADFGLPEDALVFCVFGPHLKIGRAVFDAWLEVLRKVPDSVLWMSLGKRDAASFRNLRAHAERSGVDPERLITAARVESKAVHLARHLLADLFLDTFDYNAASTMSDALRAGLPVLTLRGESFASRIGASFLVALGMEEMVMESRDAFVAEAVALAGDPERRARLRRDLERARDDGGLFDARRFVRSLEKGVESMWEISTRSRS